MTTHARAGSILAGALLVGVALAGCTDSEGTNEGGYVAGDGQVTEIAPDDRGEPVALTGETLDGAAYDVARQRGKPVVVNIWWSGCGPCKTEMPMLQEASQEVGDDVAFLGVNTRDLDVAQAQAFDRVAKVDYPSIYDPSGKALLAFHGQASLFSMPQTLVLDSEGRVAASIRGAIPSKTTLTTVIEDVDTGSTGG